MIDIGTTESLPALLLRSAQRYRESPALVHPRASGRAGLTHAALLDRAERGAAVLRSRGIRPGHRVLLVLEPGPEWGAAFFAIQGAGAVAVPLPVEAEPTAIARVARVTGACVVVAADPRRRALEVPLCVDVLQPERLFASDSRVKMTSPVPAPDDPALLVLTSGSTGHPRLVEVSHRNLLSNLRGLCEVRRAGVEHALLATLTPAHLFGLTVGLLAPLACGSRVVFPGPPLPNRLLDCLRDDDLTHALVVPALVQALCERVVEDLR